MFYLLFILPLAYGYQAPKTSLSNSELLRYKNYFRPIPFKTLVEEMDSKQIESVYFTPGMDSVIAEEKDKSETSIADDYTTTQISPSVSNYIVDDAMKQGVKPVFLQNPQPTIIESFLGGTFQVFNFIFP